MLSTRQAAAFCRAAGGACCLSRRGDWWTRLATNLVHLRRKNEALEQVGIGILALKCGEVFSLYPLPSSSKPET